MTRIERGAVLRLYYIEASLTRISANIQASLLRFGVSGYSLFRGLLVEGLGLVDFELGV